MERILIILSLVSALLTASLQAAAYTGKLNDAASLEAFIGYHSTIGSESIVRGIVEVTNESFHSATQGSFQDYRLINADLEKYTHAFDVLDLIMKGASTTVATYRTYQAVLAGIKEYKRLLEEYKTKILGRRGGIRNFSLDDSVFYTRSRDMVQDIGSVSEDLCANVAELAAIIAGKTSCKTRQCESLVDNIQDDMEAIRKEIYDCLYDLSAYMRLRTGFHNIHLTMFRPITVRDLANASLEAWRRASRSVTSCASPAPVAYNPAADYRQRHSMASLLSPVRTTNIEI